MTMNINELEELAKKATPGPWLCDWPADEIADENEHPDVSVWQRELFVGKFINNICFDNSIINGNYIAAANPSAISELIAAYREAVAALNCLTMKVLSNRAIGHYETGQESALQKACDSIDTAKRLGVE